MSGLSYLLLENLCLTSCFSQDTLVGMGENKKKRWENTLYTPQCWRWRGRRKKPGSEKMESSKNGKKHRAALYPQVRHWNINTTPAEDGDRQVSSVWWQQVWNEALRASVVRSLWPTPERFVSVIHTFLCHIPLSDSSIESSSAQLCNTDRTVSCHLGR